MQVKWAIKEWVNSTGDKLGASGQWSTICGLVADSTTTTSTWSLSGPYFLLENVLFYYYMVYTPT